MPNMPELDKNDLSAYGNSYATESDAEESDDSNDSQMSYYD